MGKTLPGTGSHRVTVTNVKQTLDCGEDSTILAAAIAAGIDYPYTCASGNCGACVSQLDAGEVVLLAYGDGALSAESARLGRTLACRAQPRGDVSITWLGRGRR
jgi:ferredoxin